MVEEIKDIDVTIAENSEEKFWVDTQGKIEKEIEMMERSIEINNAILAFIKTKLK